MAIRFPMTRERTGRRSGPRYRRVVDVSGLHGAAACSARMVDSAMRYRDQSRSESSAAAAKIGRLGMRVMALWARIFAGQIDQHDARLDAANDERTRLIRAYCAKVEGIAA